MARTMCNSVHAHIIVACDATHAQHCELARAIMICNFILLLSLLPLININFAKGWKLKLTYDHKQCYIKLFVFRSGGDFSFSCGTSLSGRRSAATCLHIIIVHAQ